MTSTPPPPSQPGGDPVPSPGGPQPSGPAVRPPPPGPEPLATSPSGPEPTARTRTSSTYVAVGGGIVVLILVLIFIIQNLKDARVSYLGAHFQLPVGVLMLISLVAGGLIVLLVSLARVAQLRVRARRARHDPSGRVR